MHLVINKKGVKLARRNQSFHIHDGKNERIINPSRVHTISIFSFCTLNTSVLKLAASHQIPIFILDHFGESSVVCTPTDPGSNTQLRRKQAVLLDSKEGLKLAKALIIDKVEQQVTFLNYLKNRKQGLQLEIDKAIKQIHIYKHSIEELKHADNALGTLRGLEGNCSRQYWKIIHQVLPLDWRATGRMRFRAKDPFNALLNYAYGMLYQEVEKAILTVGLDRAFGVLHADSYGKPTLAFDLIEPFRSVIDKWLITLILSKKLPSTALVDGILSKVHKSFVIKGFYNLVHQRIGFKGEVTTLRNHLHRYAGSLKKTILSL